MNKISLTMACLLLALPFGAQAETISMTPDNWDFRGTGEFVEYQGEKRYC